ncbi:MAG: RNA-binding protein [Nanoarchaeota archaeon]|nr:MAG: RNA-binding protein [Nanoarchaeota archaeon]
MHHKELVCNSCKEKISNNKGTAKFKCPGCMDVEIIRCAHCRETATRYVCPGCGFSGPN